jgi:transposase
LKAKRTTEGRRKYDTSFREEVVRMILSGRPIREISQTLRIGENLIYKWKARYAGNQLPAESAEKPLASQGLSVGDYERLKAKLREVEQERDILKKALGIFSRGS